jgi:protein SMG6
MRLLEINVINIALIDLISKSNSDRTQQLEHSVQFGMDMFALIVKQFNHLLKKIELKGEWDQVSFEFGENTVEMMKLFPSIKIFVDWMSTNVNLWIPATLDQNWWASIASMFNIVSKQLLSYRERIPTSLQESPFKIKLDEDLELSGFAPLFTLPRQDYDYQNDKKIELKQLESFNENVVENIKTKKRMEKIVSFADYLSKLDAAQIEYDSESERYIPSEVSPIKTLNKDEQAITGDAKSNHEARLNVHKNETFQSSIENSFASNENQDEMNKLMEKHRALKVKMEEHEQMKQNNLSIIEKSVQRHIEIEVRPKVLILDTNCFIDHLNLVEKILNSNHFIIMIPLLVINEIHKLAKTHIDSSEDSAEHAEYVQKSARRAMAYLNQKFEKKTKHIKAMTSQGSTLDTIKFRNEEVIQKVMLIIFI